MGIAFFVGLHSCDRCDAMQPPPSTSDIPIFVGQSRVYGMPLAVDVKPADAAFHNPQTLSQLWSLAATNPWDAYRGLWLRLSAQPNDVRARSLLSLTDDPLAVELVRGRAAPRELNWERRQHWRAQTTHFVIYSTATQDQTHQVAIDLERYYWIWTQHFFPLWIQRDGFTQALRKNRSLPPPRRRMRVILFADQIEYVQTLQNDVPGIERSTGYYSESAATTLLFASDTPDLATRYHELTHQLLKESTTSRLRGGQMAGDGDAFWIVEGIACYMESTRFGDRYATVGGPLSGQMQFARRRLLADQQSFNIDAFVKNGRSEVQTLDNLGQWYT
ncbi:MAG: hypothetical protein AAFP69_14670, partial [Planctomycetota bacterium]